MGADPEQLRTVVETWAEDAVAFAEVLRCQDSSWGSEHFAFGGGAAVLCGPGLYVNRAFAAGFDGPLDEADWNNFESRCGTVGVAPMVEVSPLTSLDAIGQLASRGYEPDGATSALFRTLDAVPTSSDSAITITSVPPEEVGRWQQVAAVGWGHTTPDARRASDAFAAAAAVVDAQMLVAFDATSAAPLGCASLTVRNGIATLGGMATLPAHRRRGVQGALIDHRLRLAVDLGCTLATTTAESGGGSERNLIRHGFFRQFLIESHVAPLGSTR